MAPPHPALARLVVTAPRSMLVTARIPQGFSQSRKYAASLLRFGSPQSEQQSIMFKIGYLFCCRLISLQQRTMYIDYRYEGIGVTWNSLK